MGIKAITHVVGARPNFMKAAPVIDALRHHPNVSQKLVHTGQHYDKNMSDVFFRQLELPVPDYNLEVGSGSHAKQTAEIMVAFEAVLERERPDLIVVYGDVNSTIAAALVASKAGVRIAHVEAGLRSNDRSMPEEINRLLTDRISDILLTPSPEAEQNLVREGIEPGHIHFIGNVMIDTLVRCRDLCRRPGIDGLAKDYVLVTLHRPSNVDSPEKLRRLVQVLEQVGAEAQVVFPVHPRTRARLEGILSPEANRHIKSVDPVGYLEFLWLQKNAKVVITDSGGIQEETTFLGVPCITVRQNTERPVTITEGTNVLVGDDMDSLRAECSKALSGAWKRGRVPEKWDGKAGERAAMVLVRQS